LRSLEKYMYNSCVSSSYNIPFWESMHVSATFLLRLGYLKSQACSADWTWGWFSHKNYYGFLLKL